jgi:hypothetical protein
MPHLTEEVCERYLNDLSAVVEIAEIEEHLQVCNDCCSRLLGTARSLRILREEMKEETAPLAARHETPRGAVGFIIRPHVSGQWVARVLGPDFVTNTTVTSREEAESFCRRSFGEAYPDHRCTAKCRGG